MSPPHWGCRIRYVWMSWSTLQTGVARIFEIWKLKTLFFTQMNKTSNTSFIVTLCQNVGERMKTKKLVDTCSRFLNPRGARWLPRGFVLGVYGSPQPIHRHSLAKANNFSSYRGTVVCQLSIGHQHPRQQNERHFYSGWLQEEVHKP